MLWLPATSFPRFLASGAQEIWEEALAFCHAGLKIAAIPLHGYLRPLPAWPTHQPSRFPECLCGLDDLNRDIRSGFPKRKPVYVRPAGRLVGLCPEPYFE